MWLEGGVLLKVTPAISIVVPNTMNHPGVMIGSDVALSHMPPSPCWNSGLSSSEAWAQISAARAIMVRLRGGALWRTDVISYPISQLRFTSASPTLGQRAEPSPPAGDAAPWWLQSQFQSESEQSSLQQVRSCRCLKMQGLEALWSSCPARHFHPGIMDRTVSIDVLILKVLGKDCVHWSPDIRSVGSEIL